MEVSIFFPNDIAWQVIAYITGKCAIARDNRAVAIYVVYNCIRFLCYSCGGGYKLFQFMGFYKKNFWVQVEDFWELSTFMSPSI